MFGTTVVLLAFLGISAAFVIEDVPRTRRSASYQGPLAQLNKDGSVALTPEVQQARAYHEAAIAAEFKRLEDAKNLAAAYPDLTSPPDHGWNHHEYNALPYHQDKGYHTGYYEQVASHHKGLYSTSQGPSHNPKTHMPAPLNEDGTVALTPEVQMAKAVHDAAFDAELKRLTQLHSLAMTHPDRTSQEHSAEHHNHGIHSDQLHSHSPMHSKNPEARIPAPLNPDGTVAQTDAYKAIASSLNAEYEKVLRNRKHQMVDPHFKNQAAKGYSY